MSQQQLAFASLSSITVRFHKLDTFIWPHLTTGIQGGKGGNSLGVFICMKRFTLQSCQLSASATYTKILILSCAAPVSQRGGGGWISATALRQQLTQRTHFQPAWGRQWSKCHQSCSSAVLVRLQAPAEKLLLQRLFFFFLHISSKIPTFTSIFLSTLKVFLTHFAE